MLLMIDNKHTGARSISYIAISPMNISVILCLHL